MKNLLNIWSFMLALSLVLFSCGDDDEATVVTLEGTLWVETSFTAVNCTDPTDNESSVSGCTSVECYTIQLSGGTLTTVDLEQGVESTETGTYTVSGNTISVSFSGENLTINYSISGNTLTLTFDEPDSGCDVTVTYTASS